MSALNKHSPLAADGVHEDARQEARDEEAEVGEGGDPTAHVVRELEVAFVTLIPLSVFVLFLTILGSISEKFSDLNSYQMI